MKRREWLILLAVLAAYLAARGPDLLGPFIFPFENAFQEAIAQHHLPNHFLNDRFLPVIARFDGQNFYHTAHPPLLHLIYAVLYLGLGVHEYVTRGFALICFLGSFVIWRAMLGQETENGWAIFPLAFFLPVPFILLTTTNYEPLSIFMVSLIAWLVLFRNAGLKSLLPIITLGMLVDWPVYLAVPALLIMKWREPGKRRMLMVLLAYEALFFFALQAYQYSVAGEAAFFSHATTRMSPLALFALATWRELFSHYLELTGIPMTIITTAILLAWLSIYFKTKTLKGGQTFLSGHNFSSLHTATTFFSLFLILLLLSAPQLVARHYVYLLYFTPLLALAALSALSRAASPKLALIALLLLFAPRDFILSLDRNPSYHEMALWAKKLNAYHHIKSVFASSAVGAWYYYGNIETAYPVSEAMSLWLGKNKTVIVHLDVKHPEVLSFVQMINEENSAYSLAISIPGERVFIKKYLAPANYELLLVENQSGDFRKPESVFISKVGKLREQGIAPSPPPTIGVQQLVSGLPEYALRQHPGEQGSALILPLRSGIRPFNIFYAAPAIIRSLPFGHTDGINFLILAKENIPKGRSANRLFYSRFLTPAEIAPNRQIEPFSLHFDESLTLVTLPGPLMNDSFDDAYWLWPGWVKAPRGVY